MQIKALLFDFGDTLVHTEKFDYDQCLRKLHESLTKDNISMPYEQFKSVYFETRDKLYMEAKDSLREPKFTQRITQTLKHFGYQFKQQDVIITRSAEAFADAFTQMMQMEPYVPKLLNQLKTENKYKIGLVSNFALPPAVKKTLERFNIAKYFDTLTISGEAGWRKPNPKIFKKALQTLNTKSLETVFIGDSPHDDIEGAKNLGMKAILIKKVSINEDEELGNPDKQISELKELPKALSELQDC